MKMTIKAIVNMKGKLPREFVQAMGTSLSNARSFVYQGVEFTCNPGDGYAPVFALFEDGRETLPAIFDRGGVPLSRVFVALTNLPKPLPPKRGRYYRDSEGPDGNIGVTVDPTGETSRGSRQPVVRANGKLLPSTLAFLREVMSGKLEPDYRDL
ncbi:MAG TPA: hypothetical protein VFZ48_00860 [Candidatus Saccharimonadales bacterium]